MRASNKENAFSSFLNRFLRQFHSNNPKKIRIGRYLINKSFAIGVLVVLILILILIAGSCGARGKDKNKDKEKDKPATSQQEQQAEEQQQAAEPVPAGAWEVLLGSNRVAVFSTEAEANAFIDRIKLTATNNADEAKRAKLTPEMSVKEIMLAAGEQPPTLTTNVDQVIAGLLEKSGEVEEYVCNEDDTMWGIAQAYGVDLDELLENNPDIDPDSLSAGDVVRIFKGAPKVVVTVEDSGN